MKLFTSKDAIHEHLKSNEYLSDTQVCEMTLRAVADLLKDRDDFDAITINPDRLLEWFPLSPGSLVNIRKGEDPRPEARILKARSIAELHLFLDQESMSKIDRAQQLEYWNEATPVAHYHGTNLGRRAKSFRFEPVVSTLNAKGTDMFGEGTSNLLCAGYLLGLLHGKIEELRSCPEERRLANRAYVVESACLAWELLKILGEREEFHWSMHRTVGGAKFVRSRYELASRSWVENAFQSLNEMGHQGK